jgi:uncharacterized protein YbaR (Trm112 family)
MPDSSPNTFRGFAPRYVAGLRCPEDNSELQVESSDRPLDQPIFTGALSCKNCRRVYPIEEGILRFFEEKDLPEEARHEMNWRDQQGDDSIAQNLLFETKLLSRLEVPQHVAALKLDPKSVVLELACGRGRFTVKFLKVCRSIVAVDFSLSSLRFLARRIDANADICLIQADITRLRFAPKYFNRAFSTTPLDSREQRLAMHGVVSNALTDDGRYVFSTEHYDWRNRLLGNPRLMRYRNNGSLYERMRIDEISREPAPYFLEVNARPISVNLPYMTSPRFRRITDRGPAYEKLGNVIAALIRSLDHVPFIRNFGNIVLATAEHPIRPAETDAGAEGSKLFRYVYNYLKLPTTS